MLHGFIYNSSAFSPKGHNINTPIYFAFQARMRMFKEFKGDLDLAQDSRPRLQQFSKMQRIQTWINQVPIKSLDRVPENEVHWDAAEDDYRYVLYTVMLPSPM